MLHHRVQILLDDERYRKVAREAERRGVSIAAVIRDVLDRLPTDAEVRRNAIDALLTAQPMVVPTNPADLRSEIDGGHDQVQR